MYVLCVILFNTMLMAADGYEVPVLMGTTLIILNNVCTSVFICEAMVKIAAFTFHNYMLDRWNKFDFSIVAISIVDVVVQLVETESEANPMLLRILRMVRVTRILRTLRVVKSARGLKTMLLMLIMSLPALANILVSPVVSSEQ